MGTTETARFTTMELREGDIVRHHGMRLQLEGRREVERPAGVAAVVFTGRILNLAEVHEAGVVPRSWIADGTWAVQGNDLAIWAVEVTR